MTKVSSLEIKTVTAFAPDSLANTSRLRISLGSVLSPDDSPPNNNLRYRVAVSYTTGSAEIVDFISQRYNEYNKFTDPVVDPIEYTEYLQGELGPDSSYLASSRPFSPFSVNLDMLEDLFFRNVASRYGVQYNVPPGLVLADLPVGLSAGPITENIVRNDTVEIDIPIAPRDISQLTVYYFSYDTTLAKLFRETPEYNLSLNTGMTNITTSTLRGNRYIYKEASQDTPYVSRELVKTTPSPQFGTLEVIKNTDTVKFSISDVLGTLPLCFAKLNPPDSKRSYLSDLWVSRDFRENNRLVFALDIKSYLENRAFYPLLYRSPNLSTLLLGGSINTFPDLEIKKSSLVNKITAVRRSCDPKDIIPINSLGTTGPLNPQGPNSTYPEFPVADLVEVSGTHNLPWGIRLYEGVDYFNIGLPQNSTPNGTFQYGVDFCIYDCSLHMARKITNKTLSIKNRTQEIYDNLVIQGLSGGADKGLTSVFIHSKKGQVNAFDLLMGAISEFDRLVQYLVECVSTSGMPGFADFYSKEIAQGTLNENMKTIERLIRDMSAVCRVLLQQLTETHPGDPLGTHPNEKKRSISGNTSAMARPFQSQERYFFSSVYEKGKEYGYGIDYLLKEEYENKTNGPPVITFGEYEDRVAEEFSKYFAAQAGGIATPTIPAYSEPAYSYMTPLSIRTPGRKTITQTEYADKETSAVGYDYNAYGQLFADIINIETKKTLGSLSSELIPKAKHQTDANKSYNSVIDVLHSSYGVTISDIVVPQFSRPTVQSGPSLETATDKQSDLCSQDSGEPLIPAVIGGKATTDATTEGYFLTIDNDLLNTDPAKSINYITTTEKSQDLRKRAVKLPFAILGELTVNKEMNFSNLDPITYFNSMTEAGETLGILSDRISQAMDGPASLLPNQVKSMIVIATSNESNALASSLDNQDIDARRPKFTDKQNLHSSVDLISYFGEQKDTGKYPQTADPMKAYTTFLAFWLNYKKLGVVEYLQGFNDSTPYEEGQISQPLLKSPIWKKVTPGELAQLSSESEKILCRIRPISEEDYRLMATSIKSDVGRNKFMKIFEEKEIFNLPTYNDYFYLSGSLQEASEPAGTQSGTTTSMTNSAGY